MPRLPSNQVRSLPHRDDETGDPVFAQKLSTLGSYQAAVVELLKGYKDGNPALNDQIAGLYMRMGSYDAAGKYYGKNLSPQNAFTSSAVIGPRAHRRAAE